MCNNKKAEVKSPYLLLLKVAVEQVLLPFIQVTVGVLVTLRVWDSCQTEMPSSSHSSPSFGFQVSWVRCTCCPMVNGAGLPVTHGIRIENSKRQM